MPPFAVRLSYTTTYLVKLGHFRAKDYDLPFGWIWIITVAVLLSNVPLTIVDYMLGFKLDRLLSPFRNRVGLLAMLACNLMVYFVYPA